LIERCRHCTCAAFALLLAGCAAAPDPRLAAAVAAGRFGDARMAALELVNAGPRPKTGIGRKLDRTYLLNRMRLAIATLADGYPHAADLVFEDVYEVLRTQGINRDKTVMAVVINEDLKTWKGEPFEQAMAFIYTAVHHAQQGNWGNVRAAADNALFHLRDFGVNERAVRKEAGDILEESFRDEMYLDDGYSVVSSDFVLARLLLGFANRNLHRRQEAGEVLHGARVAAPHLGDLIETLEHGDYNLLLVVDHGLGPRKVATGPDGAIADFVPRTESDGRRLIVRTGDGRSRLLPLVCDLNTMARDHRWKSLEDLRLAKSHLGTALIVTGAGLGAHGGHRGHGRHGDGHDAGYAGLGLILAGAFAKAGAHADTRHCEIMPQRVYLAPLRVESPATRISLEVENEPSSRLVLTGLTPSRDPGMPQVRYVRLSSSGHEPPPWATSGRIHYANDRTPDAVDSILPYILGGQCVRAPSHQVLDAYQKAGFLRGMTLGQLEDLYRLEDIEFRPRSPSAQPDRHVLEGGRSLVAPAAGTAGFARIFGWTHPPYRPQSRRVRELADELGRRFRSLRAIGENAPPADNALSANVN
jgi:hypothetical protein